jgi:hypothetical protein
MIAPGWVSVGRYAEHAGITVQAAYRRIHAGHLGDGACRHRGRWWVLPELAERSFANRSRPCNSRAAQIEARLIAAADAIAAELAHQPPDYCRVALWRWFDQILSTEAV